MGGGTKREGDVDGRGGRRDLVMMNTGRDAVAANFQSNHTVAIHIFGFAGCGNPTPLPTD